MLRVPNDESVMNFNLCLQSKISGGYLLQPKSLSSGQGEQRGNIMTHLVWKTGQNLWAPQSLHATDFHM